MEAKVHFNIAAMCEKPEVPPISFVTVIMASLLMRPQDLQESESHEGSTPRQRRSCAAWRLLMVKVMELIWKFNADVMQEARKSLGMLRPSHVTGWLCGSPVPASSAPSVSPLPMCPVPSNKQDDLERQRQEVGFHCHLENERRPPKCLRVSAHTQCRA